MPAKAIARARGRRNARVCALNANGVAAPSIRAATAVGSRRRRALLTPAAETRTSFSNLSGCEIAASAATKPPIELPTTTQSRTPTASQNSSTSRPYAGIEISHSGTGEEPNPGRSSASTR